MPTLDNIRASLNNLDPSSEIQIGIKAVLAVHVNADPQPEDAHVITDLRSDLPADVLYSTDALNGPHMLHRLIRDYLALKGIQYNPHPDSNRVVLGLPATCIFLSDFHRTFNVL